MRDVLFQTQINTDGGNPSKDQTHTWDGVEFKFISYGTHIATMNSERELIEVTTYWDYSRTTSKYLYKWLREFGQYDVRTKKDLQKLCKELDIELI